MMKRNLLNIAFCASLVLAIPACTKAPDVQENEGKTPIELSLGGLDSPDLATKAVITDGTGKTMQAFDKAAYIFMVMQSDYGTTDYLGTHDTRYNVTRGDVAQGQGVVTFTDNNKRYWDDAHARSSQLSVWAYAQKGQKSGWTRCTFQEITGSDPVTSDSYKKTYQTGDNTVWDWQTTRIYPAIREWSVSYTGYPNQQEDDLEKQDLLFSNNLTYNAEKSWADNRLKFNFTSRQFPRDNVMRFYHAMSKITIQIKAGDGFKADGTDFTLKNDTVDLLHGLNTKGLFNIKDGEFQMIHESRDITSIPLTNTEVGKTDPYYTLEALAVPNIHQFLNAHGSRDEKSRFVDGSTDVMLKITVDDNEYKITSDALFDAISGQTNATTLTDNGTYVPLEAGKNYVFTFTIGKQGIENLTAKVAGWETVNAGNVPADNARIVVTTRNSGTPVTSGIDLYRSLNQSSSIDDAYESYAWNDNYSKSNNFSYNGTTALWSSDWFWESNRHFYHLRTVAPSGRTVTGTTGDYVTLNSAETSYVDVQWGAPFNNVAQIAYSTDKGFDGSGSPHQIYKAIGPTKNTINLTMFHMMSDVTFKVQTSSDSDAVTLESGGTKTSIKLEDVNKDGKVLMGNGLVSTTSGNVDWAFTQTPVEESSGVWKWTCGVVPQSLEDVVLVITTPDNNQYKVALKDVYVAGSAISSANISNPYQLGTGDNASRYNVNYWYPGFRYTYTFTLRKKGIDKVTATILGWEDVVAADDNVQIQ